MELRNFLGYSNLSVTNVALIFPLTVYLSLNPPGDFQLPLFLLLQCFNFFSAFFHLPFHLLMLWGFFSLPPHLGLLDFIWNSWTLFWSRDPPLLLLFSQRYLIDACWFKSSWFYIKHCHISCCKHMTLVVLLAIFMKTLSCHLLYLWTLLSCYLPFS